MLVIQEDGMTYVQLALTPRGFEGRDGYPSLMRLRIDAYSIGVMEQALVRYADESRSGTQGMHRIGGAELDANVFPITYFNGDPAAPHSLRDTWDGHLSPRIALHPSKMIFWANGFESEGLGYEKLIGVIRSWRAQQTAQSLSAAMSGDAEPIASSKSSGMSPL